MRLRDRMVAAAIHRSGGMAGRLICLQDRGRGTGTWYELPVQYAVDDDVLVVFPGHPQRKSWWRNLTGGADVHVLTDGSWQGACGRVLWADDPAYARSVLAFRRRFPRAAIPLDAPLVRTDLDRAP